MWTAHLFQVTTGQIGPKLSYESLSWSIELNGVESIQLKLRKSDLPSVDMSYWFSPWWAGVVLLWNQTPVVAGPIITRPSETFDFVTIGCGGIRSILAKRFLVKEHYEEVAWVGLAETGHIFYEDQSLGNIAMKIVGDAQKKQGGSLPISFASPYEGGIHERHYYGFNIANLNVDDILTKLSNVIDGPDIMFKPRLLRPNQLTFDMWTGTNANPRIYQKHTPVWDTTPVNGLVSEMSVVTTGTYQTDRVFGIGPGQDKGTMIKVAVNHDRTQRQFPILETTYSYGGGSEDGEVVYQHTAGNLVANHKPLQEIQMTVRGDGVIGFGEFWPGDLIEVVTKGWLAFPDGKTQMRLLSMTGDHTTNVKVSLQKEDKFT